MSLSLSLLLPKTFYQPGEAVLATVQAIFTAADDVKSQHALLPTRASLSQPTSPTARPCAYLTHLTFSATGLERTDPSFIQNLHHPEHPVDAATVRLKKVVRPMFSTADAPLMTDVELSEDTPANFLVRFRLPASLPPTFKGSAIRFSYSLDLRAEYRLQAGASPQPATSLTATTSTTLLVWPSAEAPLLRPPGRAPETRSTNSTMPATPRSLPASVAAFSAAAASRGSSLTGALLPPSQTTATPLPHMLSPLGPAAPQASRQTPPLAQVVSLIPDRPGSGVPRSRAVQANGHSDGPFGSATAQAFTGVNKSSSSDGVSAAPSAASTQVSPASLPPMLIPPPPRPSLDASTGAANSTALQHRSSSERHHSQMNGGALGTLPLRTGSVQSVVSLAGAPSATLLTPAATPPTQGGVLVPDLDMPSVIDYPLYSSQCKVRWQAVTEEQLASQFAPSTASQPRYQGQHSVQRQQHNHAFFLHQGQDDDQDSCSLLGSDSDSESDEGEDHNHYDSYFNASTYSGSSYGHGLVATSPHKYQNGNDFFALLADSEGGAQPAALSEQHTTGVGLGQKGPESVSGAESLVDGMEQQGFVLRTSGPAFPNEAPSSAAKTSVQGSGRNSIRNTAPGPPAPNKSSSMGPVGGLAAVVAPGGGGSGGGEAWGALTVTGGRKAAVFGKPYMLSSGSHPLVRIVLQGPMEGPLQPGASFTGLLDFKTGFLTPPAVRCHQVLVMLETEEIVAPECRQVVGRARSGGPSPTPSSATAVVIRKLYCEAQEMTSDLAVTHFAFTIPPSGTPSFCTPMVALRWVVRFELTVGQAINFASRPGPRPRLETISWAVPLLVLPPS